jgi:hypothetical protein
VTEEMRRRALLAAGAVALFGRPVLGEVLELPDRPASATPLPDRLGVADVETMRELTCKLEAEAQYYGGGVEVLSPVATRAERLLKVPAADATKQALVTTLADLHNVAAWAAFDSHQDDTSRYHFARAMSLGNDSDGFQYARAAYLAGVSTAERGHFNDGIKLMQLGQMRLSEFPRAQRAGELAAWINADMACALGHMGATDVARSALARARGGWQAPDADDEADMQWVTALVEMHLVALIVPNSSCRRRYVGGATPRIVARPCWDESRWLSCTCRPGTAMPQSLRIRRSAMCANFGRCERANDFGRWCRRWRNGPSLTTGSYPPSPVGALLSGSVRRRVRPIRAA